METFARIFRSTASVWMVAGPCFISAWSCHSTNCAHMSNHALIVSSSRYWFNYRHAANALSVYQLLKENGFSDDNIVLMIADEYVANDRNALKNEIRIGDDEASSLFNANVHIDYRGDDVTVESMVHALTGQATIGLPTLSTDQYSNILIYWTGHGGDQFFKFQDVEEILAEQIAGAFRQMHRAGKYRSILMIADTCQAFTLFDKLSETSPNVIAVGSSLRGQNSYAHHADPTLGLSVIEKYTHFMIQLIRKGGKGIWKKTIQQILVAPYSQQQLRADIGLNDTFSQYKANETCVGDYFINIQVRSNANERTKRSTALPTMTLLPSFDSQQRYQIKPERHAPNQHLSPESAPLLQEYAQASEMQLNYDDGSISQASIVQDGSGTNGSNQEPSINTNSHAPLLDLWSKWNDDDDKALQPSLVVSVLLLVTLAVLFMPFRTDALNRRYLLHPSTSTH